MHLQEAITTEIAQQAYETESDGVQGESSVLSWPFKIDQNRLLARDLAMKSWAVRGSQLHIAAGDASQPSPPLGSRRSASTT